MTKRHPLAMPHHSDTGTICVELISMWHPSDTWWLREDYFYAEFLGWFCVGF